MTQSHTAAIIAGLFDVKVGVGVTDPRASQPALVGSEGDHLIRAIPKRKCEFAAGRAAARAAMAQLGAPPHAIPAGPDRAPIWPQGLRGSISHKSDLCAAVVTQAAVSPGLDLEDASDLDEKLVPSICSPSEIAQIEGPSRGRLAKLIFSAKEAAYKAQYPLSRQIFGFHHLHVHLDQANRSFTARFLQAAGPFGVGTELLGRYDLVAGHIVTAVSVPHALVAES